MHQPGRSRALRLAVVVALVVALVGTAALAWHTKWGTDPGPWASHYATPEELPFALNTLERRGELPRFLVPIATRSEVQCAPSCQVDPDTGNWFCVDPPPCHGVYFVETVQILTRRADAP